MDDSTSYALNRLQQIIGANNLKDFTYYETMMKAGDIIARLTAELAALREQMHNVRMVCEHVARKNPNTSKGIFAGYIMTLLPLPPALEEVKE